MAKSSLHRRIALGFALTTAFTLVAFAAATYVALRIEESDDQRGVQESEEHGLAAEASERMLLAMLAVAPAALLVAVGGGLWLSRRALAPIDSIVAAAQSITASGLSQRLVLPTRKDELHLLTKELNGLFVRLETGFGALSRYAADASHELRTPLAVAGAELEVALRQPRTAAEWRHTAEKSLAEIRRLARLVESLLSLARAEGPLDRQVQFDVRAQVDEVLAARAQSASDRGLSLSRAAEGGEAPAGVTGDPDALASAVRNLIDNAVAYTPSGGSVRVGVDAGSTEVSIWVEDTGPGIAASERDRIMLPLERGAAAVGHPEGQGLGLAITSRIVDRHHGTIAIEDRALGGARFVIRLPRT